RCLPTGRAMRLKVRSRVGLIPLLAPAVFDGETEDRLPAFRERAAFFAREHAEFMTQINHPLEPGVAERRLLAPFNRDKLRRILRHMLDESEFLSPFGIRALSRVHRDHPYVFSIDHHTYRFDYEPAESTSSLFGAHSKCRGPFRMPVNALLIHSLRRLYSYYGDGFTVECPTGSGTLMTLWDVADEIARRVCNIFVRDDRGRRAVFGGSEKFQRDPHWRDLVLFYEYFHGDNGAGIGASH